MGCTRGLGLSKSSLVRPVLRYTNSPVLFPERSVLRSWFKGGEIVAACCQFGQGIYESGIPEQIQNPRNYRWKGTMKYHLSTRAKAGLFCVVNSAAFCPYLVSKAILRCSQSVLGSIVFLDTSVCAPWNLWKSRCSHNTQIYDVDEPFFMAHQEK